jgi:YVTN family beta-propeller protein
VQIVHKFLICGSPLLENIEEHQKLTTFPRNIALAVVVLEVVGGAAAYVSLTLPKANNAGGSPTTSSTQCPSPSLHLDANLTLGSQFGSNFPGGMAYDAHNGMFYITSSGSDSLYVVNPNKSAAVAIVTGLGEGPSDVAYDPANGYISMS